MEDIQICKLILSQTTLYWVQESNCALVKLICAMDFQVSWIGQFFSVKFENAEGLLCWFLNWTAHTIKDIYGIFLILYISWNVQDCYPSEFCNLMKLHWQFKNICVCVFMLCVCLCVMCTRMLGINLRNL